MKKFTYINAVCPPLGGVGGGPACVINVTYRMTLSNRQIKAYPASC